MIVYIPTPTAFLNGTYKVGPMVGRFSEVLLYIIIALAMLIGVFNVSFLNFVLILFNTWGYKFVRGQPITPVSLDWDVGDANKGTDWFLNTNILSFQIGHPTLFKVAWSDDIKIFQN